MPGYLLAALGGLLLGGIVNLLSDRLPAYRMTRSDDEMQLDNSEVEPEPERWKPLARYIAVEILMAVLVAYLWHREGLTPMLGVLSFYITLFGLVAVIDIEHRLVLNVVMLPAFAIALVEVALNPRISFLHALAGYAMGQIMIMGVYLLGALYLWIVNTSRSKPVLEVAFGGGDVTLVTFCGLILGFPDVLFLLVLMIVLGGLISLLYLVYRAAFLRDYKAHTPVPYAPSIVIAATLMLLWGPQIGAFMLGGR